MVTAVKQKRSTWSPKVSEAIRAEIEKLDVKWGETQHHVNLPANGTSFFKKFDTETSVETFKGKITAYDAQALLFHVVYDDNDEEDMEWSELAPLLGKEGNSNAPRPFTKKDLYEEFKKLDKGTCSEAAFETIIAEQRKKRKQSKIHKAAAASNHLLCSLDYEPAQ